MMRIVTQFVLLVLLAVVSVYTVTRQDPTPEYLTSVTGGDNPFGLAHVT